MDLREVLMDEMSDVGRERERSMAIMVLWIERMFEWKVVYGDDVEGARVCT
jgi:hypothetical protein